MTVRIGIIGGSGLYDMAELTSREEKSVSTPFGDPSGPYVIGTLGGELSKIAADSAEAVGATVHRRGTYVNMEGPQFSTLAESKLYRSWGMDVIGMTNLQEAKLAREAEICYAILALVTDYDSWHPVH